MVVHYDWYPAWVHILTHMFCSTTPSNPISYGPSYSDASEEDRELSFRGVCGDCSMVRIRPIIISTRKRGSHCVALFGKI